MAVLLLIRNKLCTFAKSFTHTKNSMDIMLTI